MDMPFSALPSSPSRPPSFRLAPERLYFNPPQEALGEPIAPNW